MGYPPGGVSQVQHIGWNQGWAAFLGLLSGAGVGGSDTDVESQGPPVADQKKLQGVRNHCGKSLPQRFDSESFHVGIPAAFYFPLTIAHCGVDSLI